MYDRLREQGVCQERRVLLKEKSVAYRMREASVYDERRLLSREKSVCLID